MSFRTSVSIGDFELGISTRPMIVAELSGNHCGSLAHARYLVRSAARAGVDAVKIQTYTAACMALNHRDQRHLITELGSPWFGKTLYDVYSEGATPASWHEILAQEAQDSGIGFFSSPFSFEAIRLLSDLNVPCFKIASFEITHLPLIKAVAETNKPIILSTGMATEEEIEDAVEQVRVTGNEQLILLKCTSAYPAPSREANLLTLTALREKFHCLVGLSDHTLTNVAAISAVPLGARIIEKHYVHSRKDGGLDASFSVDFNQMKRLVIEVKDTFECLGVVNIGPSEADLPNLRYRRSIYAIKDIFPQDLITSENTAILRPAGGLTPKQYTDIENRKAKTFIPAGTLLDLDMVFR